MLNSDGTKTGHMLNDENKRKIFSKIKTNKYSQNISEYKEKRDNR